MLNVVLKNKFFKYLSCILLTILFISVCVPLFSVFMEIIFKFGNIVGTFIRAYGC